MPKFITVKFTKPYAPYAEGDVAGFSEKEVKELEKEGVVKRVAKSIDEAPADKMINEPKKKK